MFNKGMTNLLAMMAVLLLSAFSAFAGEAARVSSPAASDSTATVRRFRLYFACDKTRYDENYLDNALTADAIIDFLGELDPERIQSITVTSYASPEGVYEHNLMLSRLRGQNFETVAKTRFPLLNGQMRLIDGGEAWAPFHTQIEQDLKLGESVRVRILGLLDDDSVRPDTKKWRLQNRFGADTWRYILSNHFTYLRCVEIVVVYDGSPAAANQNILIVSDQDGSALSQNAGSSVQDADGMVVPEAEVAIIYVAPKSLAYDSEMLVDAIDATTEDDILPPALDGFYTSAPAQKIQTPIETPADQKAETEAESETETETESESESESEAETDTDTKTEAKAGNEDVESEDDDLILPVVLPEDLFARKPIFALSTNAIYDLAITPNFAVEMPLGHNWSVLLDYTFPWWLTRANDRAWQIIKLDLGARYWMSRHNRDDRWDILTGHFVGIDLGAGYYDIEPRHKGYQGEFQTAGLEYGYAWRLGKYWRLQAFGAIGWMGTHYRYYEANQGDTRLIYKYPGRYTWFGPTKLGVSIEVIIPNDFWMKKRR